MQTQSRTLTFKDFTTTWYTRWAKELKQDKQHLDHHQLRANKFWQNAALVQALYERDLLQAGSKGLGFGVGQERLPALFAKYQVAITATDQDFKTKKAGHWAAHELATGTKSLNSLDICSPRLFRKQLEYMPVDMSRIPKKLFNKYDFLWSNCALGHLGSIPAGLKFIEDSLQCLKPGGWAVHTTELNVLSNRATVTSGSTVIFRLKDIYKLYKRLVRAGYQCQLLQVDFGRSPADNRISLRPPFGNDFSKIQVGGHLATQIILMIHKPAGQRQRPGAWLPHYFAYRRGRQEMKRFRQAHPEVVEVLKKPSADFQKLAILPKRAALKLALPVGKTKQLRLSFHNTSSVPIYSADHPKAVSFPIVLGTDLPRDNHSRFAGEAWSDGANRPASDFWVKKAGKLVKTTIVKPGQDFSMKFTLSAKGVKTGTYQQGFCLLKEQVGWLDSSSVSVTVHVGKGVK